MAVHNELGKVYEKAAYYHLLSGRTSRMSGEIAQAIEHFETAEQQYMKTGSVPPDMQFEIDENLSFLYEQDASFSKAEARAKHALLTGFDQLGWRRYAMLQMRVAQLADNAGRYNDALEILLNLHTLLDACTDDSRDCAQAYELHAELAQALTQVGRVDEGAAFAEEALSKLALQPRTDVTRRLQMHLMIALTDAHTSLGHYKQVSNLLVDVCNQATQMRAQDTLLEALVNLADLHVILGEYDQARETISEINTLVQRLGDESALAASSLTMARLLFDQGRYAEALPHLDKTDELIASTGYNAIYPQALSLRALAYINLERSDEALPLLEKAYPVGQASGSRETVAWLDVTQAMYEMSRNELTKALALAQNALRVFQEESSRYEQALTLRVIGMAYRQQGLLTQSRKCYADAASLYATIGNKHLLKITEEESER
jgi:tetratricopeptide (TPR) repeat protein